MAILQGTPFYMMLHHYILFLRAFHNQLTGTNRGSSIEVIKESLLELLQLVIFKILLFDRCHEIAVGTHNLARCHVLVLIVEPPGRNVTLQIICIHKHRDVKQRCLKYYRRIIRDQHIRHEKQIIQLGISGQINDIVLIFLADMAAVIDKRMMLDNDRIFLSQILIKLVDIQTVYRIISAKLSIATEGRCK